MPSPDDLQQILICPLCHSAFRNPTTLHCGHALCSHHLDAPSASCPVPACAQLDDASATRPHIPRESNVQYTAAPPEPVPVTEHRSDVTLNKIIMLVNTTVSRLNPSVDDNDDSEEEEDDDGPTALSTARPASRRCSSPRPRKRHKRHHSPEDEEDDDEPDLLSHLQTVAARERLVPSDQPLLPPNPPVSGPTQAASDDAILGEFDKKLLEELTCHICYVLFYQPVTTPCQHTYCAKCLQRSLDHSTTCPICRQQLPPYIFHDQPTNKSIMAIILKAYPLLYQERGATIEEEERHARLNTPIFVCNLSFPGFPTLLHFFEPRYRLMLRRCLESPSPRFGMLMSAKPGSPQTDYGTMLEIRSVQMLPDGRSMVETWGTSRFRILERGSLDGYMVGRVERIDDYADDITETLLPDVSPPPSPSIPLPPPAPERPILRRTLPSSQAPSSSNPQPTPPQRPPTNAELMTTCRTFLDRLQRGAAPWVVQRLSSTYGEMPSDPSLFSFWVALVLPIEEHEKAKLLPIRSPRLRLMLVVHWIEQLNNNWYALVARQSLWRERLLVCVIWTACVLTLSRFFGWV